MSKSNTTEPRKLQEIFYKSVRFKQGFQMALGQSNSSQLGLLECSTKTRPSRYSARWIVGSPVLFIKWLSSKDELIEYDIPLSEVMGCTRIPRSDEPAPVAQSR